MYFTGRGLMVLLNTAIRLSLTIKIADVAVAWELAVQWFYSKKLFSRCQPRLKSHYVPVQIEHCSSIDQMKLQR